VNLEAFLRRIRRIKDIDRSVDQLKWAVISSYCQKCPAKTTRSPGSSPWWNKKLSGSKTKNKGTGDGVHCHGTRRKCSFSLGQYTVVFQAEVYAIKPCEVENLDRDYKNRNIYILSDSQGAIEALVKYQITSKLV
jgi:hypothetical protein